MNDQIDLLLQAFSLKARVIFVGNLCNMTNFDAADGVAHLHILRAGSMDVLPGQGQRLELREPALLFYPRPTYHRLLPVLPEGADLIEAGLPFTPPVRRTPWWRAHTTGCEQLNDGRSIIAGRPTGK